MENGAVTTQLSFPFQAFEEELANPIFGHQLTDIEAFVASLLLDVTSEKPMKSDEISEAVFNKFGERLSFRKVKLLIRSLRRDHAFPILSSRSRPFGYFWCKSQDEMIRFEQMWLKQVMDELVTLQIMKKHNYPRLANQLRFKDIPNLEGKI